MRWIDIIFSTIYIHYDIKSKHLMTDYSIYKVENDLEGMFWLQMTETRINS